jgi:hypothetical protein
MVPGNFDLKPGATFTIPWQAGKVTKLTLFCDNTFADATNGITAEAPQKLRLALRDAAGAGVDTLHVAIGRAANDTTGHTGTLTIPLASNASVVYVTREDAGTKNVGFLLT